MPEKAFERWKDSDRIQRFEIQRERGKTRVLDIQPFFKSLKRGSLEAAAEMLASYYKDPSLVKVQPPPTTFGDEFGERLPETEDEWLWFDQRVRSDARLTSVAAEFLYDVLLPKFIPEPKPLRYYSWGTASRVFFDFPQMCVRMGKTVYVKTIHRNIRDLSTFAGRSESFSIGAIPPSYYLDITSLYPLCAVATDAYRIIDAVPMTRSELNAITKPDDYYPYCWLHGTFESDNDLWGLPERGKERKFYLTGRLSGRLRHSLDLQAAKAKIISLDYGYKPVFTDDRKLHDQYAELTLKRIEGRIQDQIERMGTKEILNSSTGAVGANRPQPTTTSNFPAYSTIVAEGHLIASRVLDFIPKPIHYMDTDSGFGSSKREGRVFDITDLNGQWTIPVNLGVKGYGEHPKVFRSKHYYLDPENYGLHAVQIEYKDWFNIVASLPETATVHRQVRGTYRTRSAKGKELEVGRWYHEKTVWGLPELTNAFRADVKRVRETYDPYGLARDGKWVGSRSLTVPEFHDLTVNEDNETLIARVEKERRLPVETVKAWMRERAKAGQTVAWTR